MLRSCGGLDCPANERRHHTQRPGRVAPPPLVSSRGGTGEHPGPTSLWPENPSSCNRVLRTKGFAIGDTLSARASGSRAGPADFEDLFGQTVEIERRETESCPLGSSTGQPSSTLLSCRRTITRHLLAVTFTEPLISQWVEEEPITADAGTATASSEVVGGSLRATPPIGSSIDARLGLHDAPDRGFS